MDTSIRLILGIGYRILGGHGVLDTCTGVLSGMA